MISRPCSIPNPRSRKRELQLRALALHTPKRALPLTDITERQPTAGFQLRSKRPSVATLTGIPTVAVGPNHAGVLTGLSAGCVGPDTAAVPSPRDPYGAGA